MRGGPFFSSLRRGVNGVMEGKKDDVRDVG